MKLGYGSPPGTKRTALFLSTVDPEMYSRPAADADAVRHTAAVAVHSTPTASPLLKQRESTTSSFIASKRQTAFLLGISSLAGAPGAASSNNTDGSPLQSVAGGNSDGNVTPSTPLVPPQLPAVAVAAVPPTYPQAAPRGTSSMSPPGLSQYNNSYSASLGSPHLDVPTWLRALSKQGDKVRFCLKPLHHAGSSSSSDPFVVISTMLATFSERQVQHQDTGADGTGTEGFFVLGMQHSQSQMKQQPSHGPGGVQKENAFGRGGDGVARGTAGQHHEPLSPGTLLSSSSASMSGLRKKKAHEVSYASRFAGDAAATKALCPAFSNPFFLDDPDISGERRRKRMHMKSCVVTVISFADKRSEKKDINKQFFLRHANLEALELKLSHIRSIKTALLQLCLEEQSPLELCTVAYAAWYFERLVSGMLVSKQNRKLMAAVCVTVAIKFWESGNIGKKVQYAWTKLEALFDVSASSIREAEFEVFVALEFTLLPPTYDVGNVYMERLLHIMNITPQEYFSKNFDQRILWEE